MDIRYSGKNMSVTSGMRDHFKEKLMRLEKFSPKLVEAHVILNKGKYYFEAEVTLLGKNLKAYGEAQAKDNVFAAIDQACERVEKQLKKFREKVKDHHRKEGGANARIRRAAKAIDEEVNADEKLPTIVPSNNYESKPMSIEEASMQFELSSKKEFFVFQNSKTQQINVLFKRPDGNHGLIEPEF